MELLQYCQQLTTKYRFKVMQIDKLLETVPQDRVSRSISSSSLTYQVTYNEIESCESYLSIVVVMALGES